MISRLTVFIFLFVFLFSSKLWAQDQIVPEGSGNAPLGMEAVQVTPGYKLLVPQGAKIRRVGAQIIVEEDQEYFSRRFYELSQEIEDLKDQIKALQDQVNELKEEAKDEATAKGQ
jgi:hypothetical protein